jgi:hypothetical protein
MFKPSKDYIVIRESTPAERRAHAVMLLLGGAYSIVFWAAGLLDLWRLMF